MLALGLELRLAQKYNSPPYKYNCRFLYKYTFHSSNNRPDLFYTHKKFQNTLVRKLVLLLVLLLALGLKLGLIYSLYCCYTHFLNDCNEAD